jgi:hypothetical protein
MITVAGPVMPAAAVSEAKKCSVSEASAQKKCSVSEASAQKKYA